MTGTLISRPYYLDLLESFRDKHVIKVITGARRSGKSTLMALYRQQLMSRGVDASHIVAFNLEDESNARLRDHA